MCKCHRFQVHFVYGEEEGKLECRYTGVRSHKVVALVSSLSIEIY